MRHRGDQRLACTDAAAPPELRGRAVTRRSRRGTSRRRRRRSAARSRGRARSAAARCRARVASAMSRFAICACAEASSAESGSSRTITDGSAASARAIAIRCRWPPLNSCGKRLGRSRPAGRPARAAPTTRLRPTARSRGPRRARPSAICEPIVRRGFSDENGFWKTICSRTCSRGRARRAERRAAACPRRRSSPAVGASSPTAARASDVLPQPDLADEADDLPALDGEARAGDRPHGRLPAAAVDSTSTSCELEQRSCRGRTGSTRTGEAAAVGELDERRHARCGTTSTRVARSAGGTRSPDGRRGGVGGAPGIGTSAAPLVGLRMRQRLEQAARVRVARVAGARRPSGRTRRRGRRRRSSAGRRSTTSRRGRA